MAGVEGARWNAPEGPGSDLEERSDHPVVHVSHHDALAYCAWAGARLLTEAEWEYAARGGSAGRRYPWGDEIAPAGQRTHEHLAGRLPRVSTRPGGRTGTVPVDSYDPNGFGLYNTSGNVWEWCAEAFTVPSENSAGDPGQRVIRGGSYLCHASYCNRYRVAARSKNTPDSSTGHGGFRCAWDVGRGDRTRVALPPVTATLIWILVGLAAIGLYLSWTAGRLDRLHARIDAARAALDAQLLRRASVAQELATSGVLDPAASIVLYEAAHAARQAEEEQREVAESELSQALRAVFGEVQQVEAVREAPGGDAAATELAQAVRRVPMARRFHNDAVRAARALRRHRKVRWFRLAGHAPFPMAFEMDDEPPIALADRPTT